MHHIMFGLHVHELTFLSGGGNNGVDGGVTYSQDSCQARDYCSRQTLASFFTWQKLKFKHIHGLQKMYNVNIDSGDSVGICIACCISVWSLDVDICGILRHVELHFTNTSSRRCWKLRFHVCFHSRTLWRSRATCSCTDSPCMLSVRLLRKREASWRKPKDYLISSISTKENGGAASFWHTRKCEWVLLINSQLRNHSRPSLQHPRWPAICLQNSHPPVKVWYKDELLSAPSN